MRAYPSPPDLRLRAVLLDLITVVLLVLAWRLGREVHDAVAELNTLSRGVVDAGTQAQDTLRRAGDAVGGVPLVGDDLGGRLRAAGRDTGGAVIAAGRDGEARVTSLADLLGLVTWLVPSLLVVAYALPPRIRAVRRLTAAARVLDATQSPEETQAHRHLIAQRAAFGLPYAALLRHTRDPFGDLEAGRLDGLIAAEREAAGLGGP